jgi:hypothetical protein
VDPTRPCRACTRSRRRPDLHAYAHDGALASPQAELESFKRKRDAGPGEYELVVHGCVRLMSPDCD